MQISPPHVVILHAGDDLQLIDPFLREMAQLKSVGLASVWFDRQIEPGAGWKPAVRAQIQRANLIILLVSGAFLGSRNCRYEMRCAKRRARAGACTIVPVIVSDCVWQPEFKDVQVLPRSQRSVVRHNPHEEGWKLVLDDLKVMIEAARAKAAAERLRPAPAPRPRRSLELSQAGTWALLLAVSISPWPPPPLISSGAPSSPAEAVSPAPQTPKQEEKTPPAPPPQKTTKEPDRAQVAKRSSAAVKKKKKKKENRTPRASEGEERPKTTAKQTAVAQVHRRDECGVTLASATGRKLIEQPDARRTPLTPVPTDCIPIPAGSFCMGSSSDDDTAYSDEDPRVVSVDAFCMMAHEVTQAEFERLLGKNPSRFKDCGPDCPVDSVSRYDLFAYANRASELAGFERCYKLKGCTGTIGKDYVCSSVELTVRCRGYRAPTEAEHEYAAREGGMNASSASLDAVAWHAGNSMVDYASGERCPTASAEQAAEPGKRCGTHPIKTKRPNALGIYDLQGNVVELTFDANDPAYFSGGKSAEVLRGGSWFSKQKFSRIPYRRRLAAQTDRVCDVGFRLVRSLFPDAWVSR